MTRRLRMPNLANTDATRDPSEYYRQPFDEYSDSSTENPKSSCPILTDQQRVAVKPWFFAAAVLWGAAFVSYLAAGIYMAVSYFTSAWYLDSEILGMWVLGTVGARMLGTDICLRQMQKISGEPARSWYGFALKLMSVILAFCLVFFMLR